MRPYDDPPDIDEDSFALEAEDAPLAESRGARYSGGEARGGINRAAFELLRHSGVPLVASMYSGFAGHGPGARARTTPFGAYRFGGVDHRLSEQEADGSIEDKVVAAELDACRMTETNPGDFPEIVAVGDNDGYWATGICIEEGYVLTAGHVHALGGRKRVFAKDSLAPTETCRKDESWSRLRSREYAVGDGTRHPGFWNEPFFTHDLALLKLKSKGGKFPQKVAKIATREEFEEATVGLLVGFGAKNPSDYGTRRHGLIPILHEWMVARERWFHRIWGYDSEYEFIATAPLKKADACAGDSGAGFYVPNCPNCSLEERVECCRSFPILLEEETNGKKIKKWYCDSERCSVPGVNGEVERPEVTWKLAGMVSRQFGLGGDRCGAGSIYVKLYGYRQKKEPTSQAPPDEHKTSEVDDSALAVKADGEKRRRRSDEDRGADYYGRCITAMMAYLDRKTRNLKKLCRDCHPCGVRKNEDECDDCDDCEET